MNPYFSIKNLEILLKIVECESISEAARKLNISPSSISKSLAHLERELGVSLFHRTTRSIKLTEAGEYLVKQSYALLNSFEEVLNTTANYDKRPRGELKLTCSIAFGYSHLISLISEYKTIAPDVDVSVFLSDDFVNLNASNIDIALRIVSTPPLNYATRKLADIRWAYCASKEYLSDKPYPKTSKDLLMHPLLVYPGLTPEIKGDSNDCPSPHVSIQANSGLVLLKSVLEHQGVTYLPTYLIGEHIEKDDIIPLTIDDKLTYTTHALYALYFPSKYANAKVRSFIDFLISKLAQQPYWEKWENRFKV